MSKQLPIDAQADEDLKKQMKSSMRFVLKEWGLDMRKVETIHLMNYLAMSALETIDIYNSKKLGSSRTDS